MGRARGAHPAGHGWERGGLEGSIPQQEGPGPALTSSGSRVSLEAESSWMCLAMPASSCQGETHGGTGALHQHPLFWVLRTFGAFFPQEAPQQLPAHILPPCPTPTSLHEPPCSGCFASPFSPYTLSPSPRVKPPRRGPGEAGGRRSPWWPGLAPRPGPRGPGRTRCCRAGGAGCAGSAAGR